VSTACALSKVGANQAQLGAHAGVNQQKFPAIAVLDEAVSTVLPSQKRRPLN